MGRRISFTFIDPGTGHTRRYSLNRKLFYACLFFLFMLLCTGMYGLWKAKENTELRNELMILEAKKRQLQTIEKTMENIKQDEMAIKHMLGIEDGTNRNKSDSDPGSR